MSLALKNFGGFEHKIFLKPVNMDLVCAICSRKQYFIICVVVVRKPKECTVCGSLFCESCIKIWSEKNNLQNYISECPLRCKKSNDLKDSIFKNVGKIIRNTILNLEVECPNENCKKMMNLEEYEDHEYLCGLPKCHNSICGLGSEKLNVFVIDDVEYKFCDLMCNLSFIFQTKIKCLSNEEIIKWFHNTIMGLQEASAHQPCERRIQNLKSMIKAMSGNNAPINDLDYSPGITHFKWDSSKKGQGIQVFNNGDSLLLSETCYAFRTIIANTPFNSGVHYWEIVADRRTENELKIGITKNLNFNFDTSFSDYNFGWAFYGVGQLRHCNNATGDIYGKKFKKTGVLGAFLDMNRGILSFAIDGEYFGIGFQSEELKTGPIWAAISLLHVGGCVLQTGIPAPLYFFTDT